MKKITLPLLLLTLSALSLQAQNSYSVIASYQSSYPNLVDPISINNGEVWNYETFPEVTIPFNFKLAGQTVNRFLFDDNSLAFITPEGNFASGEGVARIFPSMANIQDRTYSSGISSSPLSYEIVGGAGNRILKIEMKNVGNENATNLGQPEDHFYMNFQIWLYEADDVLEIRYGNHNITSLFYIKDEGSYYYLSLIEKFGENIIFLFGNSSSPSYAEINSQTVPDNYLSTSYPSHGTIYRFTPLETAGLDNFSTSAVKLYPNPATSVLNITGDNLEASEYAIYNVVGKLVAKNTITDSDNVQINISNLESGLYFVKINNQYLKFIKQ